MAVMGNKGQVTVPKRIRDALGLKPGSEVTFELCGQDEAIVKGAIRSVPMSRFAKFRGSMKSGMTTDEIMALTRGDRSPRKRQ